jgi:hypothetical protein
MALGSAALILSVFMAGPSYSVNITPVETMDDCHALRTAVALTYARSEEYTKTSIPDVWETRRHVDVGNYSGIVKLECTPVS